MEEVFQSAYTVLEGKPTDFDPKKADSTTLFELLGKVLPDYDTERVHASDAKKLFTWYNILLNAGKLTPSEDDKKEEGKKRPRPRSLWPRRLPLRSVQLPPSRLLLRPALRPSQPPSAPPRPRRLSDAFNSQT